MRLDHLITGLPIRLRAGAPDVAIRAVTEDSRTAGPGGLFVARPGTLTDGRRFVADAIARGATAILTGDATDLPAGAAAHLVAADVPRAAALLAERFHDHPSRRIAVVAVTGTNGKTTVATLVQRILLDAGVRAGLIGTVHVHDGARATPATLTTPPAFELSRTLRAMADAGCRACVLEASSHALDQDRTAGLDLAGAVFTNLSGDHLDYHADSDAYANAKARLFAQLEPDAWAIVNTDDPVAPRMIAASRAPVLTTSLADAGASAHAQVEAVSIRATRVTLTGPWGVMALELPLVGRHNVSNALQAATVAHRLGVEPEAIAAALARITAPPGRLEPASAPDDDVTVLVDYAHTDDALDNALSALDAVRGERRLVVVFGCGGDRDRGKRPRMVRAAWRWADAVYVTSDNPRTEDPERIVDDVLAGVPIERRADTVREVDRRLAIARAIAEAGVDDVILIAGKGHEDYQIIGTEKSPFDDRLVAQEALATRRARTGAPAG